MRQYTTMKSNVILVGMSGAGKSTLGVLLAKALGKHFTDTDIIIQQQTGMLLQEYLDAHGTAAFLKVEEDTVSSLSLTDHVIATGGSVIYRKKPWSICGATGWWSTSISPTRRSSRGLATSPRAGSYSATKTIFGRSTRNAFRSTGNTPILPYTPQVTALNGAWKKF